MTGSWHTFFELVLATAYLVAALRLIHAAFHGRQAIRLFRLVGTAVCVGWFGYYFVLVVDHYVELVDGHWWVNVERGVQFFTVMLFIVWGFLFNESNRPWGGD